jgi:hypothetical protein
MRTLTIAQSTILTKRKRSVRLRVFIDRGSSDWVNISDLEGRDWVEGITYGADDDSSVVTMSVALKNRVEDLSLSPLMDNSKLNALGTIVDIGNALYVEQATMPEGVEAATSDWVEIFRGSIDAINFNSSPITLNCRDQGGDLDQFIETQQKRPLNVAFAKVEDVMQEILDFTMGDGVVTLYSANGTSALPFDPNDSPGWIIGEYVQRKQTVLQALRTLADQIGWYVRYLWNDSVGAFVLTFYRPERLIAARGTLTFTGQPSDSQTFVLNATTCTAKTSGATTDEFNIGSTVAETATNLVAMLLAGTESGNISSAWRLPARSAVGTLAFTGQPTALQTFAVDGVTYTAVAGAPTGNEFQIGSDVIETCNNIVTTILGGSGSANQGAYRIGQAVRIVWLTAGSNGNTRTFTEALSNATADGSGNLGGTISGHDGAVTIEWGTKGVAGNSITFTEALSNVTADGSGNLGGTVTGSDAGGDTYSFDPDRYFVFGRLSIAKIGIRNVLRVKYGVSQTNRTTIEVTDSASISKYGRRFMEVAEKGSSQIDTEGEARRMADAILEDLKEPDADLQVELPYFWPVELSTDFYTFTANEYHFDTDQELGVVGYRHQLGPNRSRTTLTLRGKPAGGFKRWLALEARPGVADQNNFYANNAAEGQAISESIGSVIVTYDDPRGMSPPINDWAFTKCHVSTSSGFTPDETNLVATARVTRFEIGGLIPGETYYIKLVIIDGDGNEAAVSTQITTATQKVGPYHLNGDREQGVLVPNQDFGVATNDLTTVPPDYWSVVTGTWGSGQDIYFSSTTHKTGQRSIHFLDDSSLQSEFFPVEATGLYGFRIAIQRGAGTVSASTAIAFSLSYYDESKSFLSTSASFAVTGPNISLGAWDIVRAKGIKAPTGARFGRLLATYNLAGGDSCTVFLDRFAAFRFLPSFRAFRNTNQATTGAWTTFTADQETYDYGAYYATGTYTFTAPEDGFYTFSCELKVNTFGSNWAQVGFWINGTGVGTLLAAPAVNAVLGASPETLSHTVTNVELQAGDAITCAVDTNGTGLTVLATGSYWTGKQVAES